MSPLFKLRWKLISMVEAADDESMETAQGDTAALKNKPIQLLWQTRASSHSSADFIEQSNLSYMVVFQVIKRNSAFWHLKAERRNTGGSIGETMRSHICWRNTPPIAQRHNLTPF